MRQGRLFPDEQSVGWLHHDLAEKNGCLFQSLEKAPGEAYGLAQAGLLGTAARSWVTGVGGTGAAGRGT
jgi:hypothetical protein